MPKKKRTTVLPPTVITLTLPQPGEMGSLLIQRGDLAHLCQFAHTAETDFTDVIQQAHTALADVESNPPEVPDTPPRKTAAKAAPQLKPEEPMLDVPTKTKKGTTPIPARCLTITGGAADENAQQQALQIAGRLLNSGLWDGKTPIGINDVTAVKHRLDRLSDKELKVLFTLEQFVTLHPDAESSAQEDTETSASQDAQSKENVTPNTQDIAPPSDNVSGTTEASAFPNPAQQPGLL